MITDKTKMELNDLTYREKKELLRYVERDLSAERNTLSTFEKLAWCVASLLLLGASIYWGTK